MRINKVACCALPVLVVCLAPVRAYADVGDAMDGLAMLLAIVVTAALVLSSIFMKEPLMGALAVVACLLYLGINSISPNALLRGQNDRDSICKWAKKAAAAGHDMSSYAKGNYNCAIPAAATARKIVPAPSPAEDISDEKLKETAEKAIAGDAEAQFNTGIYFMSSHLKDSHMGMAWLKRAAKQGHGQAQKVLGDLYGHEGSSGTWGSIPASLVASDGDESYFWYSICEATYEAAGDLDAARFCRAKKGRLHDPGKQAAMEQRIKDWLEARKPPAPPPKIVAPWDK